MDVFEHFSCHTNLPIKLKDVKDHILEAKIVDRIKRVGMPLNGYALLGGYHQYRDLHSGERIALIAFPNDHGLGLGRLVQVKEMLHVLDPHEATAPTRDKVSQLVDELIISGAANIVGLPAYFDRRAILMALTILLPRDALSDRRPAFKNGKLSAAAIADEAQVPTSFVEIALRDDWEKIVESI